MAWGGLARPHEKRVSAELGGYNHGVMIRSSLGTAKLRLSSLACTAVPEFDLGDTAPWL